MLRLIKWIKIPALKNIVGQIINWNKKPYKVVGVVKEMVMQLPYEPVQPTIFSMDPGSANIITVRMKPTTSMQAALDKIETVFKKYNPGSPFEYRFTDEDYAKKLSDEERIVANPIRSLRSE